MNQQTQTTLSTAQADTSLHLCGLPFLSTPGSYGCFDSFGPHGVWKESRLTLSSGRVWLL